MGSIPLPALSVNQNQPSPLEEYAKIMQIRGQQAQQQTQELQQTGLSQQNQMQALQLKDAQTLRSLSPQFLQKDDKGNVTGYDFKGLIGAASGAGVSPQTLQKMQMDQLDLTQKYAATDEATRNDALAKNKTAYDVLEGVRSQKDPAARQSAYQQGLQQLQKVGVDTSKYPPQAPSDDDLNSFEAGLGVHQQILADAKTQAETAEANAKTNEEKAGEFKEIPGTGTFWNPNTNEVKTPTGTVLSPQMAESKFLQIQTAKKLGQPVSKDDQAFADSYRDMKTMVPQFTFNMQQGALQDNALDMAAKNYLMTGQMPTGLRSPGMSSAIINRAGELSKSDPTMSNIASNRAAYDANKTSLDNLQKNLDQVTAFENTAGKNLDQFLTTAKKVVDSGSPWINKPLRSVAQQGLGDADMAAYNAARQTALTEIAKVLSSSNATGVTSDSARNEVSGLIGPDASLKQIYSAANILKQDMANRHTSYQQQVQDIKGRFSFSDNNAQPSAAKDLGPAPPEAKEGDTGSFNGTKAKIVNGRIVPQ